MLEVVSPLLEAMGELIEIYISDCLEGALDLGLIGLVVEDVSDLYVVGNLGDLLGGGLLVLELYRGSVIFLSGLLFQPLHPEVGQDVVLLGFLH
jgi:hypothetical protein